MFSFLSRVPTLTSGSLVTMDALRSVIILTSGPCQGWHLWLVSCPGNRSHFPVFCTLSNYGSCRGHLNIALWGCFPVHADVFLVVRFCSRVAVSTLKLRPQVCFVISCAMVSRSVWFCGSVPRARSQGGPQGCVGSYAEGGVPFPALSFLGFLCIFCSREPPLPCPPAGNTGLRSERYCLRRGQERQVPSPLQTTEGPALPEFRNLGWKGGRGGKPRFLPLSSVRGPLSWCSGQRGRVSVRVLTARARASGCPVGQSP